MKSFFTSEYCRFLESRLEFHMMVCRTIRVVLSVLILLIFIIRLALNMVSRFEIIATPIGFFWNIFLSSLSLKLRNTSLITFYLATTFLAVSSIALEISINSFYKGVNHIFFGLEIGIFFSFSFLFKLSVRKISLCLVLLLCHILYKLFSYQDSLPISNPAIVIILFLTLEFILIKIELYEFENWKNLQGTHRQLLHFKQIMQIFPSKIMIWNKAAWENEQPIYINEEAKAIYFQVQKDLGPLQINDFLKKIVLDSHQTKTTQDLSSNAQIKENSISITSRRKFNLWELIKNAIQARMLRDLEGFQSHLSTFLPYEDPENSREDSLSRNLINYAYKRFEIILGRIEWDKDDAVIVILNDISKTEEIKELKILHSNKDQLLATISHELRTPLNGIIGMIEMAVEKIAEKKIKKILKIAQNSAKGLMLTINDLLDVSQLQKGSLKLNYEVFNLNDLISKLLPLISFQIKQKGLELNYKNTCSLGLLVKADFMRLQQIIMNLLINAYKFTDRGCIQISVHPYENRRLSSAYNPHIGLVSQRIDSQDSLQELSVASENKDPDEDRVNVIIIKIEDTGIGIKNSQIPQIFKQFGRVKKKKNSIGMGMGLAVSQSLAKSMGTMIEVCSELGVGSSFWFKLNTYKPEEESSQKLKKINDLKSISISQKSALEIPRECPAESKKGGVEGSMTIKKRVLVVEDDQINQMVLDQYLKNLPECKSEKAYNGKEAIDIVLREAEVGIYFDLILMDCNMPVMDGITATTILRKFINEGRIPSFPIVALTANVSINERKDIEFEEVWNKPILKNEFIMKMRSILKG